MSDQKVICPHDGAVCHHEPYCAYAQAFRLPSHERAICYRADLGMHFTTPCPGYPLRGYKPTGERIPKEKAETLDQLVLSVLHGYAENSQEMQESDDDPYELGRKLDFHEYILYWGTMFLQNSITDIEEVRGDLSHMLEELDEQPTKPQIQTALANCLVSTLDEIEAMEKANAESRNKKGDD